MNITVHSAILTKKKLKCLNLEEKNISLERCAEILKYDDIKKISRRVNGKIEKMTNVKRMNEWIENVYWKNVIQNQ